MALWKDIRKGVGWGIFDNGFDNVQNDRKFVVWDIAE